MSKIIAAVELGFPWQTLDPFLFCAHHNDAYPAGDARMAPVTGLRGRSIGNDFSSLDGWSMYHGDLVPGFPQHPHRGFETITIARQGFIDHSDSLGASARFGQGDVQWMTAGRGVVHSEMFPLINEDRSNPTELFQIWLNLPAKSKMAAPYFSMYWDHLIPRLTETDLGGKKTRLALYAGEYPGATGVRPPPDSWASVENSGVRILSIQMEAGAVWKLPAAAGLSRVLYFFQGDLATFDGEEIPARYAVQLASEESTEIRVSGPAEFLLLEGRPIGEPVAQYGPFVMNTEQEIRAAYEDYRRTHFGGWPWKSDAPVHDRSRGRFASHADGRIEEPEVPAGVRSPV